MIDPARPSPASDDLYGWRAVHAVLVILVLGAFLFSLRGILNPFVLFLLFVFLVSPRGGSRYQVLLISATGMLTLVWLLQTTGFLLAPFFLALVLAYVLHPLVARIERPPLPVRFREARFLRPTRSVAVFLLALPVLVGVTLLITLGIPALSREVEHFIGTLPALIHSGVGWAEQMQLRLARSDIPYFDEEAVLARLRAIRPDAVVGWVEARQADIAQQAWRGILGMGRGVGSILSILSYVFLTPILTFYLLRDWDRITRGVGELVPGAARTRVLGFFSEYDRLLAGYMRGQLIAAATVGVLTWLGFWMVGFPYALLLGAVAGIFNVVPYMGLVVSLIPALAIALFSGEVLLSLGKIAAVFTVVQLLDSSVIGPKIVGEAVGLHPVWVILALAMSGFYFGFVGLLIAVPLAVLVKLLLERALARYRGSRLFAAGAPGVVPVVEE